jgi:hypothetical protein
MARVTLLELSERTKLQILFLGGAHVAQERTGAVLWYYKEEKNSFPENTHILAKKHSTNLCKRKLLLP